MRIQKLTTVRNLMDEMKENSVVLSNTVMACNFKFASCLDSQLFYFNLPKPLRQPFMPVQLQMRRMGVYQSCLLASSRRTNVKKNVEAAFLI